MGCRKSRTMYSIVSTENTEVLRYENTWNIHKNSFQELEAVCRRSSTATLNKLLAMINQNFSLNIPPDLFDACPVSYKEFIAFFILQGKGAAKDKNRALWCLFDTNLEETLSKSEFKSILSSVIVASIEVSLKYYSKSNNSTLIATWYQQLKERKDSLEIKLSKHFLEENDSISYEVFRAKCEEMPLGLICGMSAIRTQLEHTQVIPTRFANPFKTMKITKLTS